MKPITEEQIDKVWARVKEIEREHGWLTHINRETIKIVLEARELLKKTALKSKVGG